jgi:hypothetical protein
VAHFRGHRLKRISVKPGTAPAPGHTITYLGRTVIRFDLPDGVVAFAGYHAENRFCPRCRFPGGYREDERAARDILEEVAPGGPERLEERTHIWRGWERESRRLIRVPAIWSGIEALAAALVERGSLDGPEAYELVEAESSRRRPGRKAAR